MARPVKYVDVWRNKFGKSRGMGTITFEGPGEATWVVAMFNGQILWGRPAGVKMDKNPAPDRDGQAEAQVEPQLPWG